MILALALALIPPSAQKEAIPIQRVLLVDSVGRRGRSPILTDGLESARVLGTLTRPSEGSTLLAANGETRTWRTVEAGEDGTFSDRNLRNSWAFALIPIAEAGSYVLDAKGHSYAIIDGYPRGGDVYGLGTTRLPMYLREGVHEFYFRISRSSFTASLIPAPVPVFFETVDPTLPDLVPGLAGRLLIGQVISNASDLERSGWSVVAEPVLPSTAESLAPIVTKLPPLAAGTQHKLPIWVPAPERVNGDTYQVHLFLRDDQNNSVHETKWTLDVRPKGQRHKRTFLSQVDGSVQYFSVVPPYDPKTLSSPPTDDSPTPVEVLPFAPPPKRTLPNHEHGPGPDLILSLHGASVEATNQAAVYLQKLDTFIVAPTNRRPFGFDWEDWGRIDAVEVLDIASQSFGTNRDRTYLTGHSMGGHGTWQIGAHLSDRFAAIGPSAGWKDFWSYGGGSTFPEDDPIGEIFARSANPSRTELLMENYRHLGVYVLHGDADQTVPVSEARNMRKLLGGFHPNFGYFERKGGGHWWGDECVDWPPMVDFLQSNRRVDWSRELELEFVTASPAIRSQHGWIGVDRGQKSMAPIRLKAVLDPKARRVTIEGDNLARLRIDLSGFCSPYDDESPAVLPPGEAVTLAFGEFEMILPHSDCFTPLVLELGPGNSLKRPDGESPGLAKTPTRMGPFKAGFDRRMVFVYGTVGSPSENAWAFAKARYDLETWRYRGNGSAALIPDTRFEPMAFADRNVILYGNQETNSAWFRVLPSQAFSLTRNEVKVGQRSEKGQDLAFLGVYPRVDSSQALVCVVGGTGLPGMRLVEQMPYFVSGVAYPDWAVFDSTFLTQGLAGVRGAGFFRYDWSAEIGAEAIWR